MDNRESPEKKRFRTPRWVAAGIGVVAIATATGMVIGINQNSPSSAPETPTSSSSRPSATVSPETSPQKETYPVHKNIIATEFWVGERADESNKFIHNRSSTWVEDWVGAYGGVDDPKDRCNYMPCDFTPKENPFYFALPYSDLDDNGNPKASLKQIPWYTENAVTTSHSQVKNRWVKATFKDKDVYAQWEDAGPYGEDDFNYVFGTARPSAPEAGIDFSPAAADYLGIDGRAAVTWQFVDAANVPDGPWSRIITTN